jgi:hypothetical protein
MGWSTLLGKHHTKFLQLLLLVNSIISDLSPYEENRDNKMWIGLENDDSTKSKQSPCRASLIPTIINASIN